MERLTERDKNGFVISGIETNCVNGSYDIWDYDTVEKSFDRLADIEDILGDDYDLDRLRELVEADRDGRCVVLPCKVGTTIYVVGENKIVEATIMQAYLLDDGDVEYFVSFECDNHCDGCPFSAWSQTWEGEWGCDGEYGEATVRKSEFGKTVFLTREEAVETLEKKEDRNA